MILSQMDVLRDATSPWTVFYHTARRSWMKVGIALLLTALLTVNAALIVTGGDGWVTREQLAGALSFMGVGQFAYWLMVVFIAILGLGLGYAWRRGVLEWK